MINFRDEEQPFYIYCHYKADTGEPFYIGKGKKRSNRKSIHPEYERAFSKSIRSKFWHSTVLKHSYTVEILLDNLTSEEANSKEVEFISLYGRRTNGGKLVNLTDGGDGSNGLIVTDENKALVSKTFRKTLEHQMQKYIIFEPMTGCWIWNGPITVGYPSITYSGKERLARRELYEVFRGKTSLKMVLEPTICNCKDCVNPYHMELNTPLLLRNKRFGESSYNSKLTDKNVIDIKTRLLSGEVRAKIAASYNVSPTTIDRIAWGKTWRQISI